MGEFEIRQAQSGDLEAASEISCRYLGGDQEQWRAKFVGDLDEPSRYLLVAEVGEALVGVARVFRFGGAARGPDIPEDKAARVAPPGFYLSGMLVDENSRRAGIGLALTTARLGWIFDRDDAAWYFANAANNASLELHQKLGFTEVTRDFHYPGVSFKGGTGVLSVLRSETWRQRSLDAN